MASNTDYYVYAYLRPKDSKYGKVGTPYYVGKGKGKRAFDRYNNYGRLPKDKKNIVFLRCNLTEEEAFAAQKHFIQYYGRVDLGTGCLRNLTAGGEGSSGFGPESRRKMSQAAKRRWAPVVEQNKQTAQRNREQKRLEKQLSELRKQQEQQLKELKTQEQRKLKDLAKQQKAEEQKAQRKKEREEKRWQKQLQKMRERQQKWLQLQPAGLQQPRALVS